MIIAAFSGVGKTSLAKLYPDKVIDFTCMRYKYNLDINETVTEASKANPDYEYIFGWEKGYVKAIKQNLCDGKIILIPSDYKVLELLENENIPYILCYPQRDAKDVYHKRYIERGNTENFIDIFIGCWDKFIDALEENSYGRHIVLEPDQYLSDVIDIDALLLLKVKEDEDGKTYKNIPAGVAALIPFEQLKVTKMNLPAFQDDIENLEKRLSGCPNLYETDSMEEHPAVFHYFYGLTDIYICEYDGKDRTFGYAVFGGDLDNSEWGYFSLSELRVSSSSILIIILRSRASKRLCITLIRIILKNQSL